MDSEKTKDFAWDFFENFYTKNIQNGKTFSDDMIKVIKEEFEKMYKQYQDYLNKKTEKQTNE